MPEEKQPPKAVEDTLWWRLINLDPAIYRGLIVAVVALLASFGVILVPAIPDQLIAVIAAVSAAVQAIWTKRGTVPAATAAVVVPEPIRAPDVVVAGPAATTAPSKEIVSAARIGDWT